MKENDFKFMLGERVVKVKGYSFPGYIVAKFTNRQGDRRYVVEHETSTGLLHIFNEIQLGRYPNGANTKTSG